MRYKVINDKGVQGDVRDNITEIVMKYKSQKGIIYSRNQSPITTCRDALLEIHAEWHIF